MLTSITEMQKLFGASTPDGLGFQFRSINKGANVLKQAVANGEDPVDAFAAHLKGGSSAASSVPATPNHQRTTPASAKRTRSVKSTGAGAKRQKVIKPDPDLESDDDVDSPEADYSELDTTPTKLKPKVLSTPHKNPPLLPHSAWTKPGEKANPQPGLAATASVAPRPAAPSYALAPIPGSGSAVLPNGYTNPATGVGYNCAPPVNMTGAQPSAAHSTAMNMNGMRRGSAFSTDSHTAGSSPPTPTLAFSFPVPNSGGNVPINHNGMGMTAGVTGMNRTNAGTGTANIMGMPPSYNMPMFETASSPTASASDAQTPQTTTSSNTVAGFGTTTMATSFKSEEFTPFGGFGGGSGTGGNMSYLAHNSISSDHASDRFDPNDVACAAELDLGEFVDGEEWDDAGDC